MSGITCYAGVKQWLRDLPFFWIIAVVGCLAPGLSLSFLFSSAVFGLLAATLMAFTLFHFALKRNFQSPWKKWALLIGLMLTMFAASGGCAFLCLPLLIHLFGLNVITKSLILQSAFMSHLLEGLIGTVSSFIVFRLLGKVCHVCCINKQKKSRKERRRTYWWQKKSVVIPVAILILAAIFIMSFFIPPFSFSLGVVLSANVLQTIAVMVIVLMSNILSVMPGLLFFQCYNAYACKAETDAQPAMEKNRSSNLRETHYFDLKNQKSASRNSYHSKIDSRSLTFSSSRDSGGSYHNKIGSRSLTFSSVDDAVKMFTPRHHHTQDSAMLQPPAFDQYKKAQDKDKQATAHGMASSTATLSRHLVKKSDDIADMTIEESESSLSPTQQAGMPARDEKTKDILVISQSQPLFSNQTNPSLASHHVKNNTNSSIMSNESISFTPPSGHSSSNSEENRYDIDDDCCRCCLLQ